MKIIRKTSEPQDFADWKAQNPQMGWDEFQSHKSRRLRLQDVLLKEQGYICCYCEREIDEDRGHFEHVMPRSCKTEDGVTEGRQRELDYHNIVFSCTKVVAKQQVDEKDDKITCGHQKGDWYDETLFITPLQEECESVFRYKDDGTVVPANGSDSDKARETIERLKLNGEPLDVGFETFLIRERKTTIAGLWKTWEKEYSDKDYTETIQWATDELTRFPDGKFAQFWTTKRQVFEEILGQKLTFNSG
jgi:uncharacterized protein (TIGR02646 family)